MQEFNLTKGAIVYLQSVSIHTIRAEKFPFSLKFLPEENFIERFSLYDQKDYRNLGIIYHYVPVKHNST